MLKQIRNWSSLFVQLLVPLFLYFVGHFTKEYPFCSNSTTFRWARIEEYKQNVQQMNAEKLTSGNLYLLLLTLKVLNF